MEFKRKEFEVLKRRLSEDYGLIQIITGPRQIGKTTLALQLLKVLPVSKYYTSEEKFGEGSAWIDNIFTEAEMSLKRTGKSIVIIDEIQKIHDWQNVIKKHFDRFKRERLNIRIVLLGSSPLLIHKGRESLAGRYELIHLTHWDLKEMQSAFKWDIEKYIAYGSYPGSVEFIGDYRRWRRYIQDSIVETSISRDILMQERIYKPALMRQLFEFVQVYSGQIISYNKMLGQLHDAGNTTTLAHYAELLKINGLMCSISKYSGRHVVRRASVPKLQVLNNALLNLDGSDPVEIYASDSELRGRMVESAIGSYLANRMVKGELELFYWRNGNDEVDFVVNKEDEMHLIEVKSGKRKLHRTGLDEALKVFRGAKALLIGQDKEKLERFFHGEYF